MYKTLLRPGAAAAAVLIGSALTLAPVISSASSTWLILHPYSGASGSGVAVNGYGFGQNEQVGLQLDGQSAQANTDNSGNFSGNLTVPVQPAGSNAVSATGKSSGISANAQYYITGYYPKASPSSWFVTPGQTVSFSGSGFAPNENITISGGGTSATITADGSGNFGGVDSMTIPYSWQNSNQTFTFTGNRSAYAISITIAVGSFYPNLNPSTYYVGVGQGMSANVTGFAPGEQVQLQVNGSSVGQQGADSSGNAGFSFNAPNSGSSFTLTAVGLSSGRTSSRTITLHQ